MYFNLSGIKSNSGHYYLRVCVGNNAPSSEMSGVGRHNVQERTWNADLAFDDQTRLLKARYQYMLQQGQEISL